VGGNLGDSSALEKLERDHEKERERNNLTNTLLSQSKRSLKSVINKGSELKEESG